MLYTNVVALEGPDCSGKTTLYNNIHKATNYKWNIRDRSFLSTLCYARQYKRDTTSPSQGLRRELCNLNNRMIVVLPPLDVVLSRLKVRGDECQNEKSIVHLWKIFEEEVQKIRHFPNVLVFEGEPDREAMLVEAVSWLESFDDMSEIAAGRAVRDATIAAGGEATIDLSLSVDTGMNFESIMKHPRESKYYRQILSDTVTIIEDEMKGKNPYNVPQGLDSRRLYYSSSSCLSSVHFLVRDDVHRNASIDTKFLCHLSSYICDYFSFPVSDIALKIRFNCAHVRRDLPEWTKNEVVE